QGELSKATLEHSVTIESLTAKIERQGRVVNRLLIGVGILLLVQLGQFVTVLLDKPRPLTASMLRLRNDESSVSLVPSERGFGIMMEGRGEAVTGMLINSVRSPHIAIVHEGEVVWKSD